ncbi:MAG: hypothetical protein JST20_09065 [Bacteroidetes bacterium]|nr:hypothetical protein [Bacteroidota bacterium]
MRIKTIIIALLISCTSLFAAEISLDYLTAKSDGKTITVEWKSTTERGIARYEVERASSDQQYRYVASVDATGASSLYHYTDEDAFMKQSGETPSITQLTKYSYRLKYIGSDNSTSYSNSVSVAHNVSGVRRTWGMIKEMFR